MSKHCHHCGQSMSYGPANVEEAASGVRVRMHSVPAWTCPACGQRQVTRSVVLYLSEHLRRLLTNLFPARDDLDHPLEATEVVFAAK